MPAVKPPFPRLNRGHPLAQGLVLGLPFHEGSGKTLNDLSGNGNNGTLANGVTAWAGGQSGWAFNVNAANNWDCGNGASLQFGGTAISAAVWIKGATPGSTQYVFGKYDNASTGWNFRIASSGKQIFVCYVGGVQKNVTSTVIVGDGNWHRLAFAYNGATIQVYTDGVPDGSLAAAGSLSANTATTLKVGSFGGGFMWNGYVDCPGLWSRTLSPAEFAADYADSWAIYRPRRAVLRASGGTAYSLSPSAGSYALAGNAAAVMAARKMIPAAGAYSVAGQAATAVAARKLAPASGSYSLAGHAAALAVSRALACASGTYTLAGQAATLAKATGYALACAAGSYALAGASAGLVVARKLSPASGLYALLGRAAALLYRPTTVPSSRLCVIRAEFSPGVTIPAEYSPGVVILGGQTMSISGQNVEWFQGEDVPVEIPVAGAPDLSGWTAALNVIDPATGAVVLAVPLTANSPTQGTFAGSVAHAATAALWSSGGAGRYKVYRFEAWRSDAGLEAMLADGLVRSKLSVSGVP